MARSTPLVSVIIPARDAESTLARTLSAVLGQQLDAGFEVIVVDDGSGDGTAAIAAAMAPDVQLVRTAGGEGPGAARNHGVRASSGGVLAFTDADCFPTPQWLARGLAALDDRELVQGAVAPDPSARRTRFDRTVEVDRERGLYQTANLLVRRPTYDRAGGFRDFVLQERGAREWAPDRRRGRARRTPIGEDTVFAWNAKRNGARTGFAADAVVHHEVVPGSLRDDLADRWHWGRDMPALAREVPELRQASFYRRWFFHSRTADFDVAVVGVVACLVLRRWWPLVAVLRYLRWPLARGPGDQGRVATALGVACGDAVTCAALAKGSVSWRSLLL